MTLEDSIVEKLKLLLEWYPVAFYDLVNAARRNVKVWNYTTELLSSNDAYKHFVDDDGEPNEAVIKTIRDRIRGKGARLRIIDAGGK